MTFDKTTFLNTAIYRNFLLSNYVKISNKDITISKYAGSFCVFDRNSELILSYHKNDDRIRFTDGRGFKYYIEEDFPKYLINFWLIVIILETYHNTVRGYHVYDILKKHPFFGEKIKSSPMGFINK